MKEKAILFNWILVKELAIGTNPSTQNHLDILKAQGINSILCLCSNKEIKPPKEIYSEFNYRHIDLPDHRAKRIITLEELTNSISILSELMKKSPVFVHCLASMERSPLVAMAWLITKQKLTYEQAFSYMIQVHKGTNPMPEQLEVLRSII